MEVSTFGAQDGSNSTMASVRGMTLEDAGKRSCRTSSAPNRTPWSRGCWPRATYRDRPADLALPSRRGVQAQWHIECGGSSPERLVLGLVVAAVLGRVFGDPRAPEKPRRATGRHDAAFSDG